MVKNLPAMLEMQVRPLGPVDLLEKETVTHFNSLAWEILWTEELVRLEYMGIQKSRP